MNLLTASVLGCFIIVTVYLPDNRATYSCHSPCRRCVIGPCRGVCAPHSRWHWRGQKCRPSNYCAITRRCRDETRCTSLARWRLHKQCSPIHSNCSACRQCVARRCATPCAHLVRTWPPHQAHCNFTCDPNCASGCDLRGYQKCDYNCTAGYTLTRAYTCAPCDTLCVSGCRVSGVHRCDGLCISNYRLEPSTNLCEECDPYCYPTQPGNCSQIGQCDSQCIPGYAVFPLTKKCEACAHDCTNCSLPEECNPDGCEPGFVFSPSTKTCEGCDLECASGCTQAGLCSGNCILGYGRTNLTVESTCNKCDPNCDPTSGCNVQGANYCDTRCKIGYAFLHGTQICSPCQGFPCPANSDCSSTGALTCNETACVKAGHSYNRDFHFCFVKSP